MKCKFCKDDITSNKTGLPYNAHKCTKCNIIQNINNTNIFCLKIKNYYYWIVGKDKFFHVFKCNKKYYDFFNKEWRNNFKLSDKSAIDEQRLQPINIEQPLNPKDLQPFIKKLKFINFG